MFSDQSYRFQDQDNQRLWGPILVGAAIVSAPFWLGLNKNNNNNNNCCYPQYYQPYYPQPYSPYQPNYQYPSYIENNNYYI